MELNAVRQKAKLALEAFGAALMSDGRDAAFRHMMESEQSGFGHYAWRLDHLPQELSNGDSHRTEQLRDWTMMTIDAVIADVLVILEQESHFLGGTIEGALVNLSEFSDGLHVEPHGERGWVARLSQFPDLPNMDDL